METEATGGHVMLFWTFKVLGHENCLIMNGGRQKWMDEERDVTKDVPSYPKNRL